MKLYSNIVQFLNNLKKVINIQLNNYSPYVTRYGADSTFQIARFSIKLVYHHSVPY